MPGIGFAMGMERLVLLLQQKEGVAADPSQPVDLFIAALGREACSPATGWPMPCAPRELRVAMDLEGRSLKSQMKQADKSWRPACVLIVGEDELARRPGGPAQYETQEQQQVALEADSLQGISAACRPKQS